MSIPGWTQRDSTITMRETRTVIPNPAVPTSSETAVLERKTEGSHDRELESDGSFADHAVFFAVSAAGGGNTDVIPG